MNPLLTVIVPVYKVEKYLPQCIDSILAQTYKNLEIILVDDGSPDRCPQICDGYAQKDTRIRVIHQENKGVSAARNAGLDIATGDYIGFVDSDDFVSPVMFEALFNLIVKYHVLISVCRFRRFVMSGSAENEDPETGILSMKEAMKKILIPGYYNGCLCNKLFDAELLNGCTPIRLDCKITVGEDLLAVIQCLLKVKNLAYTTYPYYLYRMNFSSTTHCFSQKSMTSLVAWSRVIAMLPSDLAETAKAVYSEEASNLVYLAYDTKKPEYIPFLKNERSRYLQEFKTSKEAFLTRDRLRVWGAGPMALVFCRVWNILKRVRDFYRSLK